MEKISDFERLQIESVLVPKARDVKVGTGLYLMTDSDSDRRIFEIAVNPAMQKNELNVGIVAVAFDSDSHLSQVMQYIQTAEMVIAEVKTRRTLDYGHPFEAVGAAKLARLHRLASLWCKEHELSATRRRVDVVAVIDDGVGEPVLEHLRGVG